MDNLLSFIGLMRRAGAAAIGADAVADVCRRRRAKLIVLASDAGKNTVSAALAAAESGRISCLHVPFDKTELGTVLGKGECAVFAVLDAGFAKALSDKLEAAGNRFRGE